MTKAFTLALLFALAGCSGMPAARYTGSACDGGKEASMECQIERYSKAF
ncbi:hypothetical protein WG902_22110 [Ramlibacter sp. PS3R-8]